MSTQPKSYEQKVVERIVAFFGSQETLSGLLGMNQSTCSLWIRAGRIPVKHHKTIMELSQTFVDEGKRVFPLRPDDFYFLPDHAHYQGHGEDFSKRARAA